MKARRAIINKTPKIIREPLARAFLPPDPTPATLPLLTTGAQVVSEARTWVGVPFLHQGRTRNGVDCWGLPVVVLRALNVLPEGFDRTDYARAPAPGDFEDRMRYCTPLPKIVPGCLVGIRFKRTTTHVAIYTDTDTLIHSLEKHAKVIEHGFRGMWRSRWAMGAWALPGVRY